MFLFDNYENQQKLKYFHLLKNYKNFELEQWGEFDNHQ